MTSLSETYAAKGSRARKRLLAGTGLFLTGATLLVVGIVVASTGVLSLIGVDTFGAREVAGVVAGLGVPAVFVGVFTVLPASRRERAAAAIGSAIAILGVVLFAYAYPERWAGATGEDLAFPVLTIYFVGTLITFWSLFTSIVNVKLDQPGGTVTLKRIIRRATGSTGSHRPGSKPSGSGGGSVGVAGSLNTSTVTTTTPGAASDGGTEAEVLTEPGGDSDPATAGPSSGGDGGQAGGETATSGGGRSAGAAGAAGSSGITEPTADPDPYCGNCTHFEYVRDEGGEMQPYCGYHDELMDDMEACPEWQPNTWAERTYQ